MTDSTPTGRPLLRQKTAATEASAYLGSFFCSLADLPVPPATEVVLIRADEYELLLARAGSVSPGEDTP